MQSEEADEQLVVAVASGNTMAFRKLTARHLPRCYAIARRMLPSKQDAEEAVQDAITKLWTHAYSYKPELAGFSTWFYRMLVNVCIDRQRRLRAPTVDIDDMADVLPDHAPTAEMEVIAKANKEHVRKAVQALPERQRMAVTLCYFEEFTNAQAAAAMKTHVKALEGLLVRARRSLRDSLRTTDSGN